MAVTRMDVNLPKGVWIDLYAASQIPVGTEVVIYNKGSCSCFLAVSELKPAGSRYGIPVYPGPIGSFAAVDSGEPGLWGYSEYGTTVLVQE